jgi:hypothetical protein
MGMLHTGRGSDTYGDHSCIMGSGAGLRHYCAPVAWSAGFATTVPGGDLSTAAQMPAGKRELKYKCQSLTWLVAVASVFLTWSAAAPATL